MSNEVKFLLDIQLVKDVCLFKLSWGNGQQLKATVRYPDALNRLYQEWQGAYLCFYNESMRGEKAFKGGTVALTDVDWRIKVARAEAALLAEFHQWLRSGELYEIRETIVQSTKHLAPTKSVPDASVWANVFLNCDPPELTALPWETWEIGAAIRIVRSPVNIRHEVIYPRKGRPRILVISGDDTGLDFDAELDAVKKQLKPFADVQIIGWNRSTTIVNELKAQILDALVSEQGWDALLFFGHSEEGTLTGGELAIAPNTWITMDEITPQLLKAKERGLQFALFNSCNGLNIADALINLGLSQVVVMREAIKNSVAQKFLMQFLQVLATHRDVHEAIMEVKKDLKLNHTTTFPSAYLIPSIFYHPDAVPFLIKPRGLWQFLRPLVPSRREAIALAALLTLGVLIPIHIQELLLAPRLGMQALYRNLTQQIPPQTTPPVLLVQIDKESLDKAKIQKISPLDRSYLARILKKLPVSSSSIIGIDYLLDKPTPEDKQWVAAVQQSVKRGNWIVLATATNEDNKEKSPVRVEGLSDRWSLQADTYFDFGYLQLPPQNPKCPDQCPFAYTLGLVKTLNPSAFGLRPQLDSKTNLGFQLFDALQNYPKSDQVKFWKSPQSPFGLTPIVDFSIPPERVYDRIPAWQVLESKQRSGAQTSSTQPQIIILAAGGYEQLDDKDRDYVSAPEALRFWRGQAEKENKSAMVLTGGEVHAYMVHHLLSNHLVLPIPDLWMVGVAIIVGKGTQLVLLSRCPSRKLKIFGVLGGTIAYGMIGLQAFITFGVLLPWLLPSMAVGGYVITTTRPAKRR